MTWVDLSSVFTYGSKLTSTQMQNLRDNFAALANGDSGAPKITYNSLEIGTGSASGHLGLGEAADITGHAYQFQANNYMTSGSGDTAYRSSGSADYVARWRITSSTGDYISRWQYITATDNPFLYFIREKSTGAIKHIWISSDPHLPKLWNKKELPSEYERPVTAVSISDVDKSETPIDLTSEYEEFALINYPLDDYRIIEDRCRAEESKAPYKVIDASFDYDAEKGLFLTKNLHEI